MIGAGHHPAGLHRPWTDGHDSAQAAEPLLGATARGHERRNLTMKKLMGLSMAAVAALALTVGCSKASTPNDQAAAADAQLGLGNCTQLATTWAQLFTPLQSGGASDDAKANIKK